LVKELKDAAWIEPPDQFEPLSEHYSFFIAGDPGAHVDILVEVGRARMKHRFGQE